MTCDHVFDYVGNQKGRKAANRYFKCRLCGCVKIKSDEGGEYLIPGPVPSESE